MNWRDGLLLAGILLLAITASSCRRHPENPAPKAMQGQPMQNALPTPGEGAPFGHEATVRCLHGERALSDGDELRCEDWSYVIKNYP